MVWATCFILQGMVPFTMNAIMISVSSGDRAALRPLSAAIQSTFFVHNRNKFFRRIEE